MTETRSHETLVRRFHDANGEGARLTGEAVMGTGWRHGPPVRVS